MRMQRRIAFNASVVIIAGIAALSSGPATVTAAGPPCTSCVTEPGVCKSQAAADSECRDLCGKGYEAVACEYDEQCFFLASVECEAV
jgi:hypothetical protein